MTHEELCEATARKYGLPDSGWGEDWQYRDVTCPVCHGRKYVEKKLVPKMIQAGWEDV